MPIKIVAGVIAVALFVAYVAPVVFKLKQVGLGAIILIGIVMMLVDLWQSLKKED